MRKIFLALLLCITLASQAWAVEITLLRTWGHVQRPWGYEVRMDFTDNATGVIYNEVMTFKAEPSAKELDKSVLARKASLESRIAVEALGAAKYTSLVNEEILSAKIVELEAAVVLVTAERDALQAKIKEVVK